MNGPLRVVIAHWRADVIGGAEIAILEFVNHLQSKYVFTMLVPGDGPLAQYYRGLGVETWVRAVQTRRRLFPGLHWTQSRLLSLEFRKRGVDAVLCNTLPAFGRVGDAARLAGIPSLVYLRDHPRADSLLKVRLTPADTILAVSRSVQSLAQRVLGKDYKVVHVPDHLDVDRVAVEACRPLAGKWAGLLGSPRGRAIAMIGRIQEVKQQHLFVEAAKILSSMVDDVSFWVIGSASPRDVSYETSVRKMVRSFGLEQRFTFTGYTPAAVALMARADICCIPSRMEAFPRVLLEAQAIGIPVVAAAVGGIPEMITDGVTGILFDPTGPRAAQELAERLLALLRNPNFGEEIARNATAQVTRVFRDKRAIKTFDGVLTETIRRTGSPEGRGPGVA